MLRVIGGIQSFDLHSLEGTFDEVINSLTAVKDLVLKHYPDAFDFKVHIDQYYEDVSVKITYNRHETRIEYDARLEKEKSSAEKKKLALAKKKESLAKKQAKLEAEEKELLAKLKAKYAE